MIWLILIPLLCACVLACFLLLQVLMAYCYRPRQLESGEVNAVVLIPAHNEALGVAGTLSHLQGLRVLVVADNCTDDTANVARQAGAEVIERAHETLRGKGYALDFGLQHLKANPPDVVIILDADCRTTNLAMRQLAFACVQSQRPVQALDLMLNPNPSSLKLQISEFAWRVKNWARPLGMHMLGLPCQLMGTGMAFLWSDLQRVDLASGHIAEDMKLGADFAALGKPPLFVPEALVESDFSTDAQASTGQRTRWEHGHLSVILSEFPKLFWHAIRQFNLPMLALAFDLAVPPLALFCMLGSGLALLSLSFYMLMHVNLLALILPCVFFAAMIAAVGLAWWRFGRDIISFKQLCFAPLYVFSKIPLYLKFLVNRQVEWVRSKRD